MKEHLVLYVLGEPGIGKTSLVRFLLRDALERDEDGPKYEASFTEPPNPKWTLANGTVAAGHYKGNAFDGADTIPYNGARKALEFWRDHLLVNATLTILDGARFATKPSLAFLRDSGVSIMGVHLVAPTEAGYRRARRCDDAGTEPQNASWVKGATTGAKNFATLIGAFDVDASANALVVAGEVAAIIERARTPERSTRDRPELCADGTPASSWERQGATYPGESAT